MITPFNPFLLQGIKKAKNKYMPQATLPFDAVSLIRKHFIFKKKKGKDFVAVFYPTDALIE